MSGIHEGPLIQSEFIKSLETHDAANLMGLDIGLTKISHDLKSIGGAPLFVSYASRLFRIIFFRRMERSSWRNSAMNTASFARSIGLKPLCIKNL
jgi:hypothetical protein